jgi:hypothetical protein
MEQIKNIESSQGLTRWLKMSIQRRLTEQMTRAQALKLRSLSQEAYQPKLYEQNLSQAEAARRIQVLQQEIALANSF